MKDIKYLFLLTLILCIIFSCQKESPITPTTNTETHNETPTNNTNDTIPTSSSNSASETMLNVRMTDAPTNIEEVNIDLQLVVLFGSDERDSIDLGTNAGIYNLLDFQNGVDTLIASAMVTVDTIKQVRLILGQENTVKVNGVIHDLHTPSAQQSGLKIKVDAPLDSLSVYNLILDFDADKSVKQLGNGNYKLKPVIKVVN